MKDEGDRVAAEVIGQQIDAMRRRVQQSGVMAYLAKDAGANSSASGPRKDVNKQFLSSTIRSVDQHNRRHMEDKYWKLRELEEKIGQRKGRERQRACGSRSRSPSRRRCHRSRSRSRSLQTRAHRRSSSRSAERQLHRHHHDRRHDKSSCSTRSSSQEDKTVTTRIRNSTQTRDAAEQERLYWAQKKAERTKQIWEKLHNAEDRNVSVENAPAFSSSSEDSDDDDVKARVLSSSSESDDGDRKTSKKKVKKKKKLKSKKKHKSRKE